MSEIRKVVTKPGEYIGFETEFREDSGLFGVPSRVGSVERVEYETGVYEDGQTYHKYVNVYLPWCYDPEDTETRYDVVYYQHGNTLDPELINQADYRRRIDCLFDKSNTRPFILVHTTYYFDVLEDVKTRRTSGYVPAGDGNFEGVKANFWKEVVENIIPAVELKYHTYLTDASAESIEKTREHRAFSGYSRGCVATWYMFHNAFPYFAWYVPMSCVTTAGTDIKTVLTEEQVTEYLTAPVKARPELPFFVYGICGKDHDVVKMIEQMNYVTKAPEFSFGKDPAVNNMYFSLSDYTHTDMYAPVYYDNALDCIFRGEHQTK